MDDGDHRADRGSGDADPPATSALDGTLDAPEPLST